ncbi:hypothetical protein SUGI_0486850 [Cryptomeria japonica]|nr:hypothetical protein SUGI_0486850 [Cryptomeria japonica]
MATDDLDSMRGLKDWTCLLSCGIIILTLGSHGLYLPALKFWGCWSLLVFDAVMFYTVRPYWIWIEKSLIVMIFRDHDFSQRQNKILLFISLSVIIFEGFLNIAFIREKKENYVPNRIIKILPMISNFMAEFIHRFDCGNRSLYDPIPKSLPKRRYFANVLRVSGEGLLCYSMIVQISGDPYYVDVKICEAQCQERSRSMLMTMAALSGIQATVAFAFPLCSCLHCIFAGERETKVNNRSRPQCC